MLLKIIIFWIACFCIALGWNIQQDEEIKFLDIVSYLILGPLLILMSIGAILRLYYEHLNKE